MNTKSIIFLLLAFAGLIGTWYFNIQFFMAEADTSMMNFINQTITTLPAKSIGIDITVVCLTFFAWYIPEARKLKMKHWWIYVPLSLGIALAFAFPLFLFFRERKLVELKNE